MEEDPHLRGN